MNIDGLSDANAGTSPDGGGNSAAWIAGHLVFSRFLYLKTLGATPAGAEEFERYRRGSQSVPPEGHLPLALVTGRYLQLGEELALFLDQLPEARIDEPSPTALPGTKTLGDTIAFFHMHDCYHLGQLGLARRAAGLKGAIA
jgi:uncharacterized damage-inducible protein DinB